MTELAEIITPTPERLAHAGQLLELPHVDQRTRRYAHRVVGVVYTLHRDGKVSDQCYRAHETFALDWERANRVSSAIASYGERIGAIGDAGELAELRKVAAWRRTADALASVASASGRMALVMTVSPRKADAVSTVRPYTLEEIGREVSHFRTRSQATAAAFSVLDSALWQLHRFYEPG